MTAKDKRRAKAITADKYPLTTELCSCGCEMYRIVDSRGELVAMTAIKDSQGKAEFIVQACNSHEALVAAVKAQEDEVKHARDCDSCSPGFSCTEGSRLFLDALRLRRAALAQVDSSPPYPPPVGQTAIYKTTITITGLVQDRGDITKLGLRRDGTYHSIIRPEPRLYADIEIKVEKDGKESVLYSELPLSCPQMDAIQRAARQAVEKFERERRAEQMKGTHNG